MTSLPKCAALGCDDYADPRWYICGPGGKSVMACDGHGTIHYKGKPCQCPPYDPVKVETTRFDRINRDV